MVEEDINQSGILCLHIPSYLPMLELRHPGIDTNRSKHTVPMAVKTSISEPIREYYHRSRYGVRIRKSCRGLQARENYLQRDAWWKIHLPGG